MFECEKCGKESSRWRRCDEHYACDSCGTREGIFLCSDGVRCEKCYDVVIAGRVAAFDGDTEYTDDIVCPYCGHEFTDCYEYSEGEEECPECEGGLEIQRNVSVTYTTTKLSGKPPRGVSPEPDDGVPHHEVEVPELVNLLLMVFGGGGNIGLPDPGVEPLSNAISEWTQAERRATLCYAVATNLAANDDEGIEIPEKPECLIRMMDEMGCHFA